MRYLSNGWYPSWYIHWVVPYESKFCSPSSKLRVPTKNTFWGLLYFREHIHLHALRCPFPLKHSRASRNISLEVSLVLISPCASNQIMPKSSNISPPARASQPEGNGRLRQSRKLRAAYRKPVRQDYYLPRQWHPDISLVLYYAQIISVSILDGTYKFPNQKARWPWLRINCIKPRSRRWFGARSTPHGRIPN